MSLFLPMVSVTITMEVLGMAIKKSDLLEVTLIRAGKTQSGKDELVLGCLDEPILEKEKQRLEKRRLEGVYPKVERVYSSSFLRCRQSSFIIYKGIPPIVVDGFEPLDYGDLEGRSLRDEVFQKEIDMFLSTDNIQQIPGGEYPYSYTARIISDFRQLITEVRYSKVRKIALVTHGSAILAIVRRYAIPRSVINDVRLDYGEGITFVYNWDINAGRISKVF